MKKKDKIKQILGKLNTVEAAAKDSVTGFEREVAKLTGKFEGKVVEKTLESINKRLEEFKKHLDFEPLTRSFTEFKNKQGKDFADFHRYLDSELNEIHDFVDERMTKIESIGDEISEWRQELLEMGIQLVDVKGDLKIKTDAIKNDVADVRRDLRAAFDSYKADIRDRLEKIEGKLDKKDDRIEKQISEVEKMIPELRQEVTDAISRFQSRNGGNGGGNMNRQVLVDGTAFSLKYNDINFVSGAGISLSTSDDDTLRRTDITIGTGAKTPTSGAVNGTNTVFTFAVAPTILVIDNLVFRKTSSDGTANWTGTTTVTLNVAPNYDLFAL